ncbi:hypothetical protein DFS34DRAFT_606108 [Phlyctochytrium arcticum]|nr:hypothetical protein DFS34DRAFT_640858 [Phlyctochytrium arcticum]KAI9103848.1 hypothetical protein DFS34DRAFT_606108 [Phlyctochytrium arcticum]
MGQWVILLRLGHLTCITKCQLDWCDSNAIYCTSYLKKKLNQINCVSSRNDPFLAASPFLPWSKRLALFAIRL